MLSQLMQVCKTRREALCKLFEAASRPLPAYGGAVISYLPDQKEQGMYVVKVVKEQFDLKRIQKLAF